LRKGLSQHDNTRALSAAGLAGYLKTVHKDVYIAEKPEDAAGKALEMCGNDEVICSFGSLFHAGAVRTCLNQKGFV
jgi:folylpolyglutamate synthase/dihydropteroate synthase